MEKKEIVIFIGIGRPLIMAAQPGDAYHLDIIDVRDAGFPWGKEDKECFLILTVPNLTTEESRKALSADYKILTADKDKIGQERIKTEIMRNRTYKFDIDKFPIQLKTFVENKSLSSVAENNVFTNGYHLAEIQTTDIFVKKPDLPNDLLEAGEEFITSEELIQLAGVL